MNPTEREAPTLLWRFHTVGSRSRSAALDTTDTTFIYALVDPRTQSIRYIGKANEPAIRLRHHLKERYKSRKCSWVQSLAKQGLAPQLLIIECVHVSQWQERERYWIAFYRAQDDQLLNDTDGGDGVHGMRHTAEARARIGAASRGNHYALGYRLTPEQCEHKSDALRGTVFTPERCKHISEAKRGHTCTEDVRAKISATLKGRTLTDAQREARHYRALTLEHRAAIGAGLRGKPKSDEHKQRLKDARKRWCAQRHDSHSLAGCTQQELPFSS